MRDHVPENLRRTTQDGWPRKKAEVVTSLLPSRWVLAADTVVVLDGAILGKPGDENEAAAYDRDAGGKDSLGNHFLLAGLMDSVERFACVP